MKMGQKTENSVVCVCVADLHFHMCMFVCVSVCALKEFLRSYCELVSIANVRDSSGLFK